MFSAIRERPSLAGRPQREEGAIRTPSARAASGPSQFPHARSPGKEAAAEAVIVGKI